MLLAFKACRQPVKTMLFPQLIWQSFFDFLERMRKTSRVFFWKLFLPDGKKPYTHKTRGQNLSAHSANLKHYSSTARCIIRWRTTARNFSKILQEFEKASKKLHTSVKLYCWEAQPMLSFLYHLGYSLRYLKKVPHDTNVYRLHRWLPVKSNHQWILSRNQLCGHILQNSTQNSVHYC